MLTYKEGHGRACPYTCGLGVSKKRPESSSLGLGRLRLSAHQSHISSVNLIMRPNIRQNDNLFTCFRIKLKKEDDAAIVTTSNLAPSFLLLSKLHRRLVKDQIV